ncbi:AMP-binding protein [Haliangium sp.]|uniref:AMP-binding protein n=1 Tax=Haliangium sp. TaxID=2663208 RepID=UPI003D0FB509
MATSSAPSSSLPPIDVGRTFDGKRILLIGTTGFVGKVVLSLLLRHYPNVGRVYALVRPGMGNSAEERFFNKVAASPAFDPLRELWQDGYDSFLREKIVPIPGDIGRPACNFDDAQFEAFDADGGLDVIINSAGLVSFTPPLESALRINALGARNVLDAARRARARLVHISTCFVAGRRDGHVWEDEPVVGYFPRRDDINTRDFSAADEIADCQRIIDHVRQRANDRVHISRFRELGAERLREQRRDPDDEAALKLAVARERKLWVQSELKDIGQQRADHWGWTNTYTYTKSLGEQVLLDQDEVPVTIVRPAVVESAWRYPFPGWNEGFNTTAPLVYLALKGHRQVVASRKPLDVIPVDMVSAGILQAAAAVLLDRHQPVYQCGTSDINPVFSARLTELTALAIRRRRKRLADDGESALENRVRARLETFPVEDDRFRRFSAPQIQRVADRLSKEIDRRLPRWGAPRLQAMAERAQDQLGRTSEFAAQVTELIDLFKPFTYDHDLHFRCDNTRALNAQLTAHDRQALCWEPDRIDWREYWFEVHFPGLEKWVFPVLDDEFGPRARSIYTHKDLLEMFDASAKLHRHRVAMRLLPDAEDDDRADDEPVVYTYGRVQDMAEQGAFALHSRGVEPGDRVMLMSENRPEWGISYFAILKAGATAVPVDANLSLTEVLNLLRASGSKVLIVSIKAADRLLSDEGVAIPVSPPSRRGAQEEIEVGALLAAFGRQVAEAGLEQVQVVGFDDVLAEPRRAPSAKPPARRADAVASLIYTSGTTGNPKGVMLTHKNLTSMAAKMSGVFRLYLHDGLLSVIPLHHTFEFSAGFLMPLVHGSSITYMEEITPENLSAAFRHGHISAMVGVPALWQLLHRRIFKSVSDRGLLLQRGFEAIIGATRTVRDKLGLNLGRLLFLPIHRRFGGRLRLLISGGSALSPDLFESFRGLGFQMLEGYGMTESSPVLTVQRLDEAPVPGSVGRALPGVDVKIFEPDEHGVGEVIAKGPNVMAGYYENPDATAEVLRAGWLHTGDLGRLDDDGNLYIVGRKKDMILGAAGENIYPDELEEVYRDSDYVKELSIVGLPTGDGAETVAALIVPDYDQGEREAVRARVREHVRNVSKQLPLYKRVKVFHLWDFDLPKTSTRKVKRREVIAELERLERTVESARTAKQAAAEGGAEPAAVSAGGAGKRTSAGDKGAWARDLIAQVSQKSRSQISPETTLEALGFDSLMFNELAVALEAMGVQVPDPAEILELATVADVEAYLRKHTNVHLHRQPVEKKSKKRKDDDELDDEISVPPLAARLGRRGLRLGMRMLYEQILDTEIHGGVHVPPFGSYIVAANHASHLDMGLVKHALGECGDLLVALAAKDYFFEDPVRKAYFENFTNLVPMERYGSLRESLRLAGDVLADGHVLLIFPEGTRSPDGVMDEFKPSLGYLAMTNRCGILPMYLAGTHDAMPKGNWLPKRGTEVAAHIGPFVTYEQVADLAAGKSRSGAYRAIANHVERTVRRMAPERRAWTLGEAGRVPMDEYLVQREEAKKGTHAAADARHAGEDAELAAAISTEGRA